jgi:hypothetical protein
MKIATAQSYALIFWHSLLFLKAESNYGLFVGGIYLCC